MAGATGTAGSKGATGTAGAAGATGATGPSQAWSTADTSNTLVQRDDSGSIAANALALDSTLVFSDASTTASILITDAHGLLLADYGNYDLFIAGYGTPAIDPTRAQNNLGIGPGALASQVTGSQNVAVGPGALAATLDNSSTAVGMNALSQSVSGGDDAFGYGALGSVITGNGNVAFGGSALVNLLSGSGDIAIGQGAGSNLTAGEYQDIYIGNAGLGGESLAIRIGSFQRAAYVAGIYGASITGGSPVVVNSSGQLGVSSSPAAVTWSGTYGTTQTTYLTNSLVQSNGGLYLCVNAAGCTGAVLTNAAYWTALEPASSSAATASTLVQRDASGNFAGATVTGNSVNLASLSTPAAGNYQINGQPVLSLLSNSNLLVGATAVPAALGGADNTGAGVSALPALSSGSSNVALGWQAGLDLTTGSNNVALGALAFAGGTSGSNNIAIGRQAGSGYTGAESSNISIGAAGTAGESGVIRLGSAAQTSTFIAGISGKTVASGVEVFINAGGQMGTVTSSRRYKEHIEDLGDDSRVLLSLRPVKFVYKPAYDPSGEQRYGLIAEEVAEVAPALVVYNEEGAPETVKYNLVNAMLLNEVQRQAAELDSLRARLVQLQGDRARELSALESRLARLEGNAKPSR